MNEADKQRIADIFGKKNYDELTQFYLEEERYEDDYDRLGSYNQRLEKIQREAAFPEVINEFRNNKESQEPIDTQQYINEAHAIDMQNKNYRQKKFKQALHDFTYLDSAEHHLIDIIKGWWNPNSKVTMSVDEARQYAKEKGVDWNAEGKETVNKYEVDTAINRELLKKELQKEIAEYSQYKDYTMMDNISRIGSAISGGVGAGEAVATVGLGWFTGPGIIAGLTKWGATLMKGVGLARGVQLAHRMEVAQKAMNIQNAVTKEIQATNNITRVQRLQKRIDVAQKAIESESIGAKLGYDFYRYGKAMPGTRASLATVAPGMMIDGLLTDIPRELIQKQYNDIFNTNEYGVKEMYRDMLTASAFSYFLPWGGAAAKGALTTTGKVLGKGVNIAADWGSTIQNKVYKNINENKAKALLEGRKAEIDKLNLEKLEINQYLQQMQDNVIANDQLSPKLIQAVQNDHQYLMSMNLTKEEATQTLIDYMTAFTTGELPQALPKRTEWLTTAPGILDTISSMEKRGATIDEIWDAVKSSGIKTKHTSSWKNGKPEETNINEFIYRLKDTYYDATSNIQGEQGFLGSKKVMGLTNADSEWFLKRLYISSLIPDTETGKLARQELLDYQNQLKRTRKYINYVNVLYNKIYDANKNMQFNDYKFGSRLWKGLRERIVTDVDEKDTFPKAYEYGYTTGDFNTLTPEQLSKEIQDFKEDYGYIRKPISYKIQKQAYRLTVDARPDWNTGSYGSIKDAIRKIIFELLPEEIKTKYNDTKYNYLHNLKEAKLAGKEEALKQSISYKENIENIDNIVDDLLNNTFVQTTEKEYKNLRSAHYSTNSPVKTEVIQLRPLPRGTSAETGKAKATESARLEYIGELLDNIIENNDELLKADDVYKSMQPSADELTTPSEVREILNTSEAERLADYGDVTTVKILNSKNASVERLETNRLSLETAMSKTEVMNVLNAITQKMEKSEAAGKTVGAFLFKSFLSRMNKLDGLLNENFTPVLNTLMEKMKLSPVFGNLGKYPSGGRITEKTAVWRIPEARAEFKRILKESMDATINESKLYNDLFADKYEKIMDEALDSFDNYLKNNMDEGLNTISTPHAYNVEVNTKEEVAQEIYAQSAREQALLEILNPFFEQLTYTAMDMQSRNYRTMTNLIDTVEKFMINPGQIDELVLSEITMSPAIIEGSSISVEALSKTYPEWSQLLASLAKNDEAAIRDGIIPKAVANDSSFEPLTKYAFNPDNFPTIKEAIFDRIRFISGEMSEEEAKLFSKKSNTRAARVANEYLNAISKMKRNLFNVGSNKNKLVNLLDSNKIKKMGTNEFIHNLDGKYANAIRSCLAADSTVKDIVRPFERFITYRAKSKEDMAQCNMALDLLEKLDLDKQLRHTGRIGYNEVRDALLNDGGIESLIETQFQKRLTKIKSRDAKILKETREKAINDVNETCQNLADDFFGVEGKDIGFINRIKGDITHVQDPLKQSFSSRYVDDIEQKFFYKNADYEKRDIQNLGFDNLKSMFDNNFGTAKNAYAVLSKLGEEPVQYVSMLKELAKEYAETIAPKAHGFKNAEKLKRKLNNSVWERSVDFNMHNVCGTYTVPANAFRKWTQLVVRTLASPMLMKAGLRSLTDYNYQLQMLITMGLATEGDLGARLKVLQQGLSKFTQDKELAQQIYMTETIRTDTLYSMLYNTSIGSDDVTKRIASGFNEYATGAMKWEKRLKDYQNFLLDKVAWIGPLTEYNRQNAALTTMKAIGGYAATRYKDMPERLQQTLTRFGISEFEWDEILSKHVVTNAKDYIYEVSEKTVAHEMSDHAMFFPELVDKIPEAELTALMEKQKLPTTEMGIARYRQYLKDKASLLINTSADEMTSMPTSRVQGALSAGFLPNTSWNFFLNTAMQFQSFGAAVNYYQWGRRLASFKTGDALFDHLIFSYSGHPSGSVMSMSQFIVESAIMEFIVGEFIIREPSGTNRRIINDRGEIQGDVIGEKVLEALGGPLGLGNMVVQTIMSKMNKATGQGGGLSIPMFPSVSTALQKIQRPIDALTKKSTEKHRAKAFAGAMGQNVADLIGIPNQPLAHQAWALLIGDSLRDWQYGDRLNAVMTQRLHRGYTPYWLKALAIETGMMNKNDSSLAERYLMK